MYHTYYGRIDLFDVSKNSGKLVTIWFEFSFENSLNTFPNLIELLCIIIRISRLSIFWYGGKLMICNAWFNLHSNTIRIHFECVGWRIDNWFYRYSLVAFINTYTGATIYIECAHYCCCIVHWTLNNQHWFRRWHIEFFFKWIIYHYWQTQQASLLVLYSMVDFMESDQCAEYW